MRVWARAGRDTLCGACNELIPLGAPMLVIEILGAKRIEKVRCARCEGPAPPDLPPLVERMPIPVTTLTRLRLPSPVRPPAPGDLPFGVAAGDVARPRPAKATLRAVDFKARATGEREPGEEG